MDNLGYLLAAYSVIWALVFGYVLYIFVKQRQLKRVLERLQETIGKQDEG